MVIVVINVTHIGNDKPSMRDLNDYVVMNVATKWKHVGIQLLQSDQEIDAIAADHLHDVVYCCKFILLKWLETTPDATWNQLIKALRSPSVQLDYFASHLEMMMTSQCKICSNHIKLM